MKISTLLKLIRKTKHTLSILEFMKHEQIHTYTKMKRETSIPNTTFALGLIKLQKLGLITKRYTAEWPKTFTKYQITSIGLDVLKLSKTNPSSL